MFDEWISYNPPEIISQGMEASLSLSPYKYMYTKLITFIAVHFMHFVP